MKILITGGGGRIGFKLLKRLSMQENELISVSKTTSVNLAGTNSITLDLSNKNETIDLIKKASPDIILHTAALANVDMCETNKTLAYEQNVEVTKNLVEGARECNSKFVFVSSSFVFNGDGKIFTEGSEYSPINYYGKTKQLSEETVIDSNLDYLILRTDQPYGNIETWQKDDNVRRVLKKLNQNLNVTEPSDWYNNPTYLDDFTEATARLINKKTTGTFNAVGPEFINRYEWGLRIADIFERDKKLVTEVRSSSLNVSAKRPLANLSNKKIEMETGMKFSDTLDGLKRMKTLN